MTLIATMTTPKTRPPLSDTLVSQKITSKGSSRSKTRPIKKNFLACDLESQKFETSTEHNINNKDDKEEQLRSFEPVTDGNEEGEDMRDGKLVRKRRSFKELVRNVECRWNGCGRVYATESSLQNHIRLKHGNIRPDSRNMRHSPRLKKPGGMNFIGSSYPNLNMAFSSHCSSTDCIAPSVILASPGYARATPAGSKANKYRPPRIRSMSCPTPTLQAAALQPFTSILEDNHLQHPCSNEAMNLVCENFVPIASPIIPMDYQHSQIPSLEPRNSLGNIFGKVNCIPKNVYQFALQQAANSYDQCNMTNASVSAQDITPPMPEITNPFCSSPPPLNIPLIPPSSNHVFRTAYCMSKLSDQMDSTDYSFFGALPPISLMSNSRAPRQTQELNELNSWSSIPSFSSTHCTPLQNKAPFSTDDILGFSDMEFNATNIPATLDSQEPMSIDTALLVYAANNNESREVSTIETLCNELHNLSQI